MELSLENRCVRKLPLCVTIHFWFDFSRYETSNLSYNTIVCQTKNTHTELV